MELPKYVENINGILYCFLKNEWDKNSFEIQCEKCPLKDNCITKRDIYKNISGDWHSLNAGGLYGEEFTKCIDKFKRKDLRSIAKIVGLALTYGGTSYTVAGNMGTSKEDAQEKIDNFFRELSTLNIYMLITKKTVLETGKVYNLFGRSRDVSRWAFSASWKDKSYAQRTALNHPIQSTSAELLKIMMIRVDEYIEANGLSPLYGLTAPRKIDLNRVSYRDFILNELMSIHDEVDYLFNEDHVEGLLSVIYDIMQIKDVMNAFGVGFDLELDCEFDTKFRSMAVSESYLNSKIYLVNKLRKNQMLDLKDIKPNTMIINFEDVTNELLDRLVTFKGGPEEELFNLMVDNGEGVYFHSEKFSVDFLKSTGINFRLAYVE